MLKRPKLFGLVLAAVLFANTTTKVYASDSVHDVYMQLVTNNQSTATVTLKDDENIYDIIAQLIQIDEETPYDADMIVNRGTSISYNKYNTNKVVISIGEQLDFTKTEALLDIMEEDVRGRIPNKATKDVTLKAIIRYITETYDYNTDNSTNYNFVDAYYGDRKIKCEQYAAITYLLCYRFGIDCKIVAGNNHAFNIIRLSEDKEYRAYDLTWGESFPGAKVPYLMMYTDTYNVNMNQSEFTKMIGESLNNRFEYRGSFTIIESVLVSMLLIILVSIIVKRVKFRAKINMKVSVMR